MAQPETDPQGILEEIARSTGAQVSAANVLDVGEHFTMRVRFRTGSISFWLYAGDRMLQADIRSSTPIAVVLTPTTPRSSVPFSASIASVGEVHVFPWDDEAAPAAAVADGRVREAILSLRLEEEEELLIARNGMSFTFRAADVADAVSRIDAAT